MQNITIQSIYTSYPTSQVFGILKDLLHISKKNVKRNSIVFNKGQLNQIPARSSPTILFHRVKICGVQYEAN